MKENTEKERIEQIEQEEMERQRRASSLRRKSSPILRRHQQEKDDSVHQPTTMSEPIPRHTLFVSLFCDRLESCFGTPFARPYFCMCFYFVAL